VPKLGYI